VFVICCLLVCGAHEQGRLEGWSLVTVAAGEQWLVITEIAVVDLVAIQSTLPEAIREGAAIVEPNVIPLSRADRALPVRHVPTTVPVPTVGVLVARDLQHHPTLRDAFEFGEGPFDVRDVFQDVEDQHPVGEIRGQSYVGDVRVHRVLRVPVPANEVIQTDLIDVRDGVQHALHLSLRSEVRQTEGDARCLVRRRQPTVVALPVAGNAGTQEGTGASVPLVALAIGTPAIGGAAGGRESCALPPTARTRIRRYGGTALGPGIDQTPYDRVDGSGWKIVPDNIHPRSVPTVETVLHSSLPSLHDRRGYLPTLLLLLLLLLLILE